MKIQKFIIEVLLSSIVLCYYTIYKGGKIGFEELTAIIIGSLIALLLIALIKWIGVEFNKLNQNRRK
jgi:hypothetical protein